jgi:hypothetical protein
MDIEHAERKPCIPRFARDGVPPHFVREGVPGFHPEVRKRRGTPRLTPRGDKKGARGDKKGARDGDTWGLAQIFKTASEGWESIKKNPLPKI